METDAISNAHSNRKRHNWLAYVIGDRVLVEHKHLFVGKLYDLGSGESPYKKFFLQRVEEYVAIDWSESIHQTRADIAADLNQELPVESEVADTVFSWSVLEHLYAPQLMLKEANRILKNGGRIVLQVPWQWWIHEAPHDYFRYTPYGLTYLLEQAGFVDVCVKAQAGFFTTVILKTNYFSRRLIRGPRPLRNVLRVLFSIWWYVGQKLAPWLDKLDDDWALEAPGYFVTARKP